MDKINLKNGTYILGEIKQRTKKYTLITVRSEYGIQTKKRRNDEIISIEMVEEDLEGVYERND